MNSRANGMSSNFPVGTSSTMLSPKYAQSIKQRRIKTTGSEKGGFTYIVLPDGNYLVRKFASLFALNLGLNGHPSIIEKFGQSPTRVS